MILFPPCIPDTCPQGWLELVQVVPLKLTLLNAFRNSPRNSMLLCSVNLTLLTTLRSKFQNPGPLT